MADRELIIKVYAVDGGARLEPIEQLVRCEDCINWPFQPGSYWEHEVFHVEYPWCRHFRACDYCSKGERIKDE